MMSDQNPESGEQKTRLDQTQGGNAEAVQGDYQIGYGKPPKQYQFKPGQSGNPRGRPRGRLSKKAVWDRIMSEPMSIREDGKTRTVTKYEGLCLAQLTKGIKGDTRSALFAINEAERAGFGEPDAEPVPVKSTARAPQSNVLFENINLELLSEADKVDLARLAAIIDLGGDITALSVRDFQRVQDIANKGRGKDVTPRQ
jgi:Family of unknown function (DUF5681)